MNALVQLSGAPRAVFTETKSGALSLTIGQFRKAKKAEGLKGKELQAACDQHQREHLTAVGRQVVDKALAQGFSVSSLGGSKSGTRVYLTMSAPRKEVIKANALSKLSVEDLQAELKLRLDS
jgi:hypothetical protein